MTRMVCVGILIGAMSVNATVVQDFNRGWKFKLGDVPEAHHAQFDDSTWDAVRLPHDWSVGLSFTQEEAGGCTGFLPGGIGWYRKSFNVPASSKDEIVRLDFDGVYNNSDVWINGHHLGHHPYGYAPFSYDLSRYLHFGETNTVVVKADRSAYMDCRWYPGSGIYRNVKLVTHDPVHIAKLGVFVTTQENQVTVTTVAVNGSAVDRTVTVKTDLQDSSGRSVGFETRSLALGAGERKEIEQIFMLENPQRWDTDHPVLYTAEVELDGFDKTTATFGVRDIRYDAETGFFLNGKRTLLKGVCLHHDGGCVGAAVPDGVWARRLRVLKEGGCNAIRTAHNPPSAAFLDLCDRMGFLVQDEAFDEWDHPKDKKYNFNQRVEDERTIGYSDHFREWAERDIKAMVLRDRNHPSIIMWSIGNEIEWTYPGYNTTTGYWEKENKVNYYWDEPPYDTQKMKQRFAAAEHGPYELADTAGNLSRWVKEEDRSRPVTANTVMPSVSYFSGYTDALDIVGYSYRTVLNQWGHQHYPNKMILGTENWVQWSEWKGVLDHPHVPGIFLWTGIDYMGESRNWPQRSSSSGMLDTAGFRKPNYWFFKSLWNEAPMVHIAVQPLADSNYVVEDGRLIENAENPRTKKWGWPALVHHWNFSRNEAVYIELYSNCEVTELFLNDKSLGVQRLADNASDRLMKWVVPFEPGTLRAVGRTAGKERVSQQLATAGEPVAVTLHLDGPDHCIAQLVDTDGIPVKHINRTVHFAVEGNARNIGVDNGNPKSTQDFQSDECLTYQGRCLMVLQPSQSGRINVTVSSDGLKPARVTVRAN